MIAFRDRLSLIAMLALLIILVAAVATADETLSNEECPHDQWHDRR